MNLFDMVDYVAILASVLGAVVGVAAGRRMRPRPPAPLRPVCSCSRYDGPDPAIFGLERFG